MDGGRGDKGVTCVTDVLREKFQEQWLEGLQAVGGISDQKVTTEKVTKAPSAH